jgi:glutamine synthetase
VSQEAEWFLAGLIDGLPDSECSGSNLYISAPELIAVMPMFCPNINSYKRLMGGAVSGNVTYGGGQSDPRHSGRQIPLRTAGTPAQPACG